MGVYEGAGDLWRRRAIIRDTDRILALLPKRALVAASSEMSASAKQISALRKVLEIPAERSLPSLHCAMASRLLDRVLFDRHLVDLVADFDASVEQRAYDDQS
ncbi:MAG: hypothetical protein C0518_12945 [Opitutus sp.]|nr:hypothetical protein [Opitutus sp.]